MTADIATVSPGDVSNHVRSETRTKASTTPQISSLPPSTLPHRTTLPLLRLRFRLQLQSHQLQHARHSRKLVPQNVHPRARPTVVRRPISVSHALADESGIPLHLREAGDFGIELFVAGDQRSNKGSVGGVGRDSTAEVSDAGKTVVGVWGAHGCKVSLVGGCGWVVCVEGE